MMFLLPKIDIEHLLEMLLMQESEKSNPSKCTSTKCLFHKFIT